MRNKSSILDGRNFTCDGLENAWKKVQDSVIDDNVTNSQYLQPAYALQLPKTIQRPYLSNSLALRGMSSGSGYLAAPVTDVFNPTEYSAVALRRKPALSSLRIADIPDDIVDRLRLLLGKYLQQSLIRCSFFSNECGIILLVFFLPALKKLLLRYQKSFQCEWQAFKVSCSAKSFRC